MYWNGIGGQGNPTRSIDVNNIIAKLKKKEVRKHGKPSQARCSLELEEFKEAQKFFHGRIRRSLYRPSLRNYLFDEISVPSHITNQRFYINFDIKSLSKYIP